MGYAECTESTNCKKADKVLIIEFKCNQSANAALKQIEQKGYADPFRQSDKNIVCLGINFSTETRNIAEWKATTLN